MKQDLFIVGGGIVAFGLAIWGLWGNPRHSPLKIVSERSPYMRTER
jgi:hypothetical protein